MALNARSHTALKIYPHILHHFAFPSAACPTPTL